MYFLRGQCACAPRTTVRVHAASTCAIAASSDPGVGAVCRQPRVADTPTSTAPATWGMRRMWLFRDPDPADRGAKPVGRGILLVAAGRNADVAGIAASDSASDLSRAGATDYPLHRQTTDYYRGRQCHVRLAVRWNVGPTGGGRAVAEPADKPAGERNVHAAV